MSLKKLLFGLSATREASFKKRGYQQVEPKRQQYLENIVISFVEGYNLALSTKNRSALVMQLEKNYDNHNKGFVYEGVGMYYGLMDFMFPKKESRLQHFITNEGEQQDFISLVGAGLALARIPWARKNMVSYMKKLDPIKAWCIADGYGFHQGIFHHKKYVYQCKSVPNHVPQHYQTAFDSGIGRSLWWVHGADIHRIHQAINHFPEDRRAELWSGLGTAASYAGGITENTLTELLTLSGMYQADFLTGIPFGAMLRARGNNGTTWIEKVCQSLLKKGFQQVSEEAHQLMYEVEKKEDVFEQAYNLFRNKLKLKYEQEILNISVSCV